MATLQCLLPLFAPVTTNVRPSGIRSLGNDCLAPIPLNILLI